MDPAAAKHAYYEKKNGSLRRQSRTFRTNKSSAEVLPNSKILVPYLSGLKVFPVPNFERKSVA